MKKRMLIMLAATAVFIALVGSVKLKQIQTAIAEASSFQPPPEAVTTVLARPERWRSTLGAIGTVAAVNGVTVGADLPGVVSRIRFESGRRVNKGEVLIQLDTSQEQAQLAAARAQDRLADSNLVRLRDLRAKGVISEAEYDRAAAEHEQAEARLGEIEATLARKTIRAPFSGILGLRQVDLGQYLTSGDPIVSLQSLDPIYVNFDLPQQEVGKLRRGAEVRATAEGVPGDGFLGRITALDAVVDESTRNIRVQASFANPDGVLRPGMFVEVRLLLDASDEVIALPASSIAYAPYGDSVFVVDDLEGPDGTSYRGVRQQFVKLGPARGDQVAVLSGLEPGAEVVSSGAFKLRSGAAVYVNNEIQPSNDPSPRPEDS